MEPQELEPKAPDRRALTRECWYASAGILVFLGAIKHLGMLVPLIAAHAATAAAVVELYVPIMLIGRRGITADDLGLDMSRWDAAFEAARRMTGGPSIVDRIKTWARRTSVRLRLLWAIVVSYKTDLSITLGLAVAVTVPFAIGHHFWQTLLFDRVFHWRVPLNLLETVFAQIVVVALPEELFFRGYLQGRLERIWPPGATIFAQVFSRAVLVAAAVFALAHFVGEYRLDRLGPLFPALIFGAFRTRTQRILGPVIFHAYCNVLGDVLWAFYR